MNDIKIINAIREKIRRDSERPPDEFMKIIQQDFEREAIRRLEHEQKYGKDVPYKSAFEKLIEGIEERTGKKIINHS